MGRSSQRCVRARSDGHGKCLRSAACRGSGGNCLSRRPAALANRSGTAVSTPNHSLPSTASRLFGAEDGRRTSVERIGGVSGRAECTVGMVYQLEKAFQHLVHEILNFVVSKEVAIFPESAWIRQSGSSGGRGHFRRWKRRVPSAPPVRWKRRTAQERGPALPMESKAMPKCCPGEERPRALIWGGRCRPGVLLCVTVTAPQPGGRSMGPYRPFRVFFGYFVRTS